MVNLIYLAHSDKRFFRQTRYSILSLMEYLQDPAFDFRLLIFTDNPGFFHGIPATFELLTAEKIAAFRGPADFVHRMKIMALIETMQKYDGHAVMLDSDNVAIRDPSALFEVLDKGNFILNEVEESLDKPKSPLGRKFRRFFRKHSAISLQGKQILIPTGLSLWNAGIVGIPKGSAGLLEEVLALCDFIYKELPKHIAEQVAFNVILGINGQIIPGKDYFYHWFGHGMAINHIIHDLFVEMDTLDVPSQIQAVARTRPAVLAAPLNPKKQKKGIRKLLKKLFP